MSDIQGTIYSNTIEGLNGSDAIDGVGGNDTLKGLGRDDLLNGGHGDDTFLYANQTGGGSDTMFGAAGDDRVELARWKGFDGSIGGNIALSSDQDTLLVADLPDSLVITDFETGPAGDVIDLTPYLDSMLTDWNGGNPFASGHLQLFENGSDTILQLDTNGGANSWQSIITFRHTYIADFTPENFGGYGVFYAYDGNETVHGSGLADLIVANNGNHTLFGGDGNDRISGGNGNDTILGGSGNDILDGGIGNDTVIFDEAGRVVVRLNSQTVSTGDTIAGFENVITGAGNDALIGSDVTNILTTGAGDDYIDALGGDDVLTGGTGNDRLFGREGNDTLLGGSGNDRLDGGAGNDTVVFDEAGRVVVRLNTQTVDTGDTIASIENVITGAGNDALIGSDVANILTSGAGDDYLDGLAGDDVLYGGTGNDRLFGRDGDDMLFGGSGNDTLDGGDGNDTVVFSYSDRVVVRLNSQTVSTGDTIANFENATTGSGDDALIGSAVANILTAGDGDDYIDGQGGDDTLNGGAGNDRLFGGDGNDTLIGGSGRDTLDGGAGNDTVVFDETWRSVVRLDTQTVNTFETISGFENATTGTGNDALIGSAVANILSGRAGDDYLDGLRGDDTLDGGIGDDRLFGRDGNDTLLGGAGNDTLDGGDGNDTVVFDEAGRVVVRLDTQTVDTGDTIAGFENATTGSGNDALIGSGGANVLSSGAGDDYIDGLGGDDVLNGGAGNDRLFGGAGNDVISGGAGTNILNGGDGIDTIDFSETTSRVLVHLGVQGASTGDMISGFENATSGSGNDALIGSGGANFLIAGSGDDYLDGVGGDDMLNGGSGNDRLFGREGNDTLLGGSGNDTLDGGDGNDTVIFDEAGRVVVRLNTQTVDTGDTIAGFENATTGAGNDALIGSDVANILTSGTGNDYIDGLGGDDTLDGGSGNDRLIGGTGNDTFVFDTTSGGSDQLLDFEQAKDHVLFTNAEPTFDTFEEIIAAGVQDGADTVFDFGDGNILRLANTTLSGRSASGNTLTADDFIFAASASGASAKPYDLSSEDMSGLNGPNDGLHTIKGNHQPVEEIALNDFDDFATNDRGHLLLPYEAEPLMTYRGQDGMLHIFDPEAQQQPDDFTGSEIA